MDSITVKRVFGDAYERNGVTLVPAARVTGAGGGGGGEGEDSEGKQGGGAGGGFGVRAQPAGAYVIDGEKVRWRPAIDVNRIALGVIALGGLALLTWRSVEKLRHGA